MNMHTATLPNGETATRNSATKTYTHMIAVKDWSAGGDEEWGALNWCGSATLAQKAAEKARRGGPGGHWLCAEIIVAELVDADQRPIWNEADKYAGDEYA